MRKEGIAKPLTTEMADQIIDNIQAFSAYPERDTAMFLVSFRAGLRVGEIASLVWGDILQKDGKIKETFSLRKDTTKGKKGGLAFLTHPELRLALEVHKQSVKSISSKAPVFLSRKQGHFSSVSMSRLFKHIYARAGFEGYSSHSGRKGLGKALNEANVNIYNIQKVLRHSSITTTVNHYISVDEDLLAKMVSRV